MDFFDWFDDIENEDLMDNDNLDDEFDENLEMDETFEDAEFDNELVQTESEEDDEFTAKDAFYTGAFFAVWHEEGLRRRKRKKFSDD